MHNYIRGLNGIRAIAVLMVLFDHKFSSFDRVGTGGYGVHLFFVLSGFLIIGILVKRRAALEAGTVSLGHEIRHFYENRVYRIWPIYFLLIAGLLVAGAVGLVRMLTTEELISLATFTSNWFQGYVWSDYPDYFGPLWSVAVEEQFYLWAAPAFLLLSTRSAPTICLITIVVALIAVIWIEHFGPSARAAYTGSFTNFGLMALGGLTVLTFPRTRWLAVLAIPAFLLYLACPALAYVAGRGSEVGVTIFWASGLLAAIVLAGIAADQNAAFVSVLEWRPLHYIGVISYGLYIYHSVVHIPLGFGLPGRVAAVMEVAFTIGIASASWHFIEKPLLHVRDRLRMIAAKAKLSH
jgi:peptidoglycan/LPS O-acetylase OafA/YrhL